MASKLVGPIFFVLTLFYSNLSFSQDGTVPSSSLRPLKIAYVIDSYDEQKSGGVITANRFIKELSKVHDITIVSNSKNSDESNKMRGFYVPFAKNKMKKNGVKFAYPNTKKLKKIFADVDLIYVHFPFYLGIKSVDIAKKLGKPVIVGFHIQPENLLLNVGIQSQKLNAFFYKQFIKKFYNKADLVICPSQFAESLLINSKHFKGKTTVISNGLTKKHRPRPSEKIKEYEGKFVILTVGRLAKEKRHDVIINAVAQSKYKEEIQLVATGSGDLKEHLEDLGSSLPNPPQFGFVSSERLTSLYNTADLYIHASEVELEGMSVLEAIGSGRPALISDAKTSASYQFALSPDFLFRNGDSEDLAKKIDYWIEHKDELKQVGLEYAESAKKYYFEESIKQMNQAFYNAVPQ